MHELMIGGYRALCDSGMAYEEQKELARKVYRDNK